MISKLATTYLNLAIPLPNWAKRDHWAATSAAKTAGPGSRHDNWGGAF